MRSPGGERANPGPLDFSRITLRQTGEQGSQASSFSPQGQELELQLELQASLLLYSLELQLSLQELS